MTVLAIEQPSRAATTTKFRQLFDEHYRFVWLSLRRLGLDDARCDDATQQVFIVASRKLDQIHDGKERAYLFGIATRVASDVRRSAPFRREVPQADIVGEGVVPRPDDVAEQRIARARLDEVLDALPLPLRAVFILFELEEMTMSGIAEMLEIPTGTVASRLRKARELFQEAVDRLKTRGGAR